MRISFSCWLSALYKSQCILMVYIRFIHNTQHRGMLALFMQTHSQLHSNPHQYHITNTHSVIYSFCLGSINAFSVEHVLFCFFFGRAMKCTTWNTNENAIHMFFVLLAVYTTSLSSPPWLYNYAYSTSVCNRQMILYTLHLSAVPCISIVQQYSCHHLHSSWLQKIKSEQILILMNWRWNMKRSRPCNWMCKCKVEQSRKCIFAICNLHHHCNDTLKFIYSKPVVCYSCIPITIIIARY